MRAFGPHLKIDESGRVRFMCPGCNRQHLIMVGNGVGPRWDFNNHPDAPTFSPSVLVQTRDWTEKGRADFEAWKAAGYPPESNKEFESQDLVCHSFITDGEIRFLGDCTHSLAGQTVALPDFNKGGSL